MRRVWRRVVLGIYLLWWHFPLLFGALVLVLPAWSLAGTVGWPLAGLLLGIAEIALLALYIRRLATLRLNYSLVIYRPPAVVFAFIATNYFQNRPRWIVPPQSTSWLAEIGQTSSAAFGVGTTGREVVEENGQRATWELVIREYTPPKRLVIVGEDNEIAAHWQRVYIFRPVRGGTDVTFRQEMPLPRVNWLWNRYYATLYAQQGRANAARIKQLIESETTP